MPQNLKYIICFYFHKKRTKNNKKLTGIKPNDDDYELWLVAMENEVLGHYITYFMRLCFFLCIINFLQNKWRFFIILLLFIICKILVYIIKQRERKIIIFNESGRSLCF